MGLHGSGRLCVAQLWFSVIFKCFFIFLVLWEEKEVTVAKKVHREFLCFKVVKNVKIYLSILMKICVKCKGCNVFQRMDL